MGKFFNFYLVDNYDKLFFVGWIGFDFLFDLFMYVYMILWYQCNCEFFVVYDGINMQIFILEKVFGFFDDVIFNLDKFFFIGIVFIVLYFNMYIDENDVCYWGFFIFLDKYVYFFFDVQVFCMFNFNLDVELGGSWVCGL